MSSFKIIRYKIYKKGGITDDRLLKFLPKKLNNVKNKIIILDNTSSHKNKKVKDFIIKNNSLLYTIFYQHKTQTIKGFFNKLKSRLSNKKDLGLKKLCQNVGKYFERKTKRNLL
jgi:transcription initiation factor IIE alpha subunit